MDKKNKKYFLITILALMMSVVCWTGSDSNPITQKNITPKIEGAIIAAQGASNANVKANIISAVEAVTGLPTHKIQVFEMGI